MKMALSQGIWTVLSIFLIFYILKMQEKRDCRQEEREKKYQSIIETLNMKLDVVYEIKSNIKDIKEKLI